MGHLADAQSHCGRSSGIFPGTTCRFSLCHLRSQAMTPNQRWPPLLGHFLLRSLTCWGPWTDLDASVVKKIKIVIWRKHPGSLKTSHSLVLWEYYLSSPLEGKRAESITMDFKFWRDLCYSTWCLPLLPAFRTNDISPFSSVFSVNLTFWCISELFVELF